MKDHIVSHFKPQAAQIITIFIRKLVVAFASRDFPKHIFRFHIELRFFRKLVGFLEISDQYRYKKQHSTLRQYVRKKKNIQFSWRRQQPTLLPPPPPSPPPMCGLAGDANKSNKNSPRCLISAFIGHRAIENQSAYTKQSLNPSHVCLKTFYLTRLSCQLKNKLFPTQYFLSELFNTTRNTLHRDVY